jgi:hypothetical protein
MWERSMFDVLWGGTDRWMRQAAGGVRDAVGSDGGQCDRDGAPKAATSAAFQHTQSAVAAKTDAQLD